MIHFISHKKKHQQDEDVEPGEHLEQTELVSDPIPAGLHTKEGPLKELDDIDFKLAASADTTVMDRVSDTGSGDKTVTDSEVTGAHTAVPRKADDQATVIDHDLFSSLSLADPASSMDATFVSKVDESQLFSEDATAVDAAPLTSTPAKGSSADLIDAVDPKEIDDAKEPWEVRDPWLEKILAGEDETVDVPAPEAAGSATATLGATSASGAASASSAAPSDDVVAGMAALFGDLKDIAPTPSAEAEGHQVEAASQSGRIGTFNPEISGRFAVGPSGMAAIRAQNASGKMETVGQGTGSTGSASHHASSTAAKTDIPAASAGAAASATTTAAGPPKAISAGADADAAKQDEDFTKYQGQFAALNRIDVPGDQKHLSSYASRLADAQRNAEQVPHVSKRTASATSSATHAQTGAAGGRSASSASERSAARAAQRSSSRGAVGTSSRGVSPSGSAPSGRADVAPAGRSVAAAAGRSDAPEGALLGNTIGFAPLHGANANASSGMADHVATSTDEMAEDAQSDSQAQNHEPLAAAMYDDLINWSSRLARETPLFSRAFSVSNAQSVIDVGCGSGRHSVLFAQWGMSVIGIDQSGMMIKRAKNFAEASMPEIREANGSVVFKRGTLSGLPRAIGNNMAEAIVCVGDVLPSVGTLSGLRSVLDSFAEFLVPMGVLVLEFSNHTRYTQQKIRATTPAVFDTSEGTKVFFSVMDCPTGSATIDADMLSLTCHEGKWRVTSEKMHNVFISPEIIQRELFDAGFDILELSGDYSGKPLDQFEDESMIIIARRKAHRPSTGGFAPVSL